MVFGGAILFFLALPPETLERLPSLSLWERIFGWSPSTGTLRALAALFHGRLRDALDYNWNVVVTAPFLTGFFLLDAIAVARKARRGKRLFSISE